jgi:hypothetical protein
MGRYYASNLVRDKPVTHRALRGSIPVSSLDPTSSLQFSIFGFICAGLLPTVSRLRDTVHGAAAISPVLPA